MARTNYTVVAIGRNNKATITAGSEMIVSVSGASPGGEAGNDLLQISMRQSQDYSSYFDLVSGSSALGDGEIITSTVFGAGPEDHTVWNVFTAHIDLDALASAGLRTHYVNATKYGGDVTPITGSFHDSIFPLYVGNDENEGLAQSYDGDIAAVVVLSGILDADIPTLFADPATALTNIYGASYLTDKTSFANGNLANNIVAGLGFDGNGDPFELVGNVAFTADARTGTAPTLADDATYGRVLRNTFNNAGTWSTPNIPDLDDSGTDLADYVPGASPEPLNTALQLTTQFDAVSAFTSNPQDQVWINGAANSYDLTAILDGSVTSISLVTPPAGFSVNGNLIEYDGTDQPSSPSANNSITVQANPSGEQRTFNVRLDFNLLALIDVGGIFTVDPSPAGLLYQDRLTIQNGAFSATQLGHTYDAIFPAGLTPTLGAGGAYSATDTGIGPGTHTVTVRWIENATGSISTITEQHIVEAPPSEALSEGVQLTATFDGLLGASEADTEGLTLDASFSEGVQAAEVLGAGLDFDVTFVPAVVGVESLPSGLSLSTAFAPVVAGSASLNAGVSLDTTFNPITHGTAQLGAGVSLNTTFFSVTEGVGLLNSGVSLNTTFTPITQGAESLGTGLSLNTAFNPLTEGTGQLPTDFSLDTAFNPIVQGAGSLGTGLSLGTVFNPITEGTVQLTASFSLDTSFVPKGEVSDALSSGLNLATTFTPVVLSTVNEAVNAGLDFTVIFSETVAASTIEDPLPPPRTHIFNST